MSLSGLAIVPAFAFSALSAFLLPALAVSLVLLACERTPGNRDRRWSR